MAARHTRRAIHAKGSLEKNPYAPMLQKMEHKLSKSLEKLAKDLNKQASYKIIEKDNNEILMLLGECNYIARECEKFEKQIDEKRKKT